LRGTFLRFDVKACCNVGHRRFPIVIMIHYHAVPFQHLLYPICFFFYRVTLDHKCTLFPLVGHASLRSRPCDRPCGSRPVRTIGAPHDEHCFICNTMKLQANQGTINPASTQRIGIAGAKLSGTRLCSSFAAEENTRILVLQLGYTWLGPLNYGAKGTATIADIYSYLFKISIDVLDSTSRSILATIPLSHHRSKSSSFTSMAEFLVPSRSAGSALSGVKVDGATTTQRTAERDTWCWLWYHRAGKLLQQLRFHLRMKIQTVLSMSLQRGWYQISLCWIWSLVVATSSHALHAFPPTSQCHTPPLNLVT